MACPQRSTSPPGVNHLRSYLPPDPTAKIVSKTVLDIVTVNKDIDPSKVADADVLDSKRKLNEFAEKATGFDAKARMKRAQKKAKEGTL